MGAKDRYDVVIVGGGSAGCALANRLSADSGTSVLVLEAGHSDWKIDPFIHMPAALPFPIGSRFYDWRYQTDPEPHLNNRRVFHARGKVLGGSSSINGMIFQRGNPMDYERWAAEPGHEGVGLRPLPALLQADGDPPPRGRHRRRRRLARRRRPPGAGARTGREPALRGVLRGHPGGRLPADRRRQRLPAGGVRPVRPQPPPRPPALRRPRLPAPGPAPQEPRRRDAGDGHQGPVRGQAGRRRRLPARRPAAPHRRRRRGHPLRRRDQHPAAAPALRRRRRVAARAASASTSCTTRPGVGENLQDHLEVYVQYASKQPVSIAPGLRWRARPGIAYQWLVHRRGLGATNHFEGGGFARSNDGRRLPEPDVPLPARSRSGTTARSPTEGHGYQVHVGPMYADTRGWVRIRSTDPKVHPSMQFNYLSTETDRREWVEAIRVARDILNQPAFAPYNDGELSPGPRGRDRRADPRLGARRRRDRAAPVVHGRHGRRGDVGRRPRLDARARPRGPARRRRLGLPVRDQRQHLRARDDGGREGGRPDRGQHPPRPRRRAVVPPRRRQSTPPARRPAQPEESA